MKSRIFFFFHFTKSFEIININRLLAFNYPLCLKKQRKPHSPWNIFNCYCYQTPMTTTTERGEIKKIQYFSSFFNLFYSFDSMFYTVI